MLSDDTALNLTRGSFGEVISDEYFLWHLESCQILLTERFYVLFGHCCSFPWNHRTVNLIYHQTRNKSSLLLTDLHIIINASSRNVFMIKQDNLSV